MNFLQQTITDTSMNPVKFGKLPKAGKVDICIQVSKYACKESVKESLIEQGFSSDLDNARPLFAINDVDAKTARKIINDNRDNLLCSIITQSDNMIYARANSEMAYNFFTGWISTNPTMYSKKVVA